MSGPHVPVRSTSKRAWHQLDGVRQWLIPQVPEYSPSPARAAWLSVVYVVRRWLVVDRCTGLAASLTVETLLSMVPITSVILFFVRLIDPDFGRDFLEKLAASLVPEATHASQVTETIIEIGARAKIDQLGGWGLLVVIVLAYWLFATLESTTNQIWRVKRTRHLIVKFPMFYTIASLAPIVVLYSVAQPTLSKVTATVLVNPYLTTALAFILLNKFMPNTRVTWRAAISGGVVSAALFELGKVGFGAYVSRISLSTYESVYGTLAVWPVFLVWVYLSWMLLLLGLEVSFVVHHLNSVRREGYVPLQLRDEQLPPAAPGRTAARLMLAIADHWNRRRRPSSIDQLNDRFGLGVGKTALMVDLLEEHGFLLTIEGGRGVVPSQPLDQIRLQAVLDLFPEDLSASRDDELSRIFRALDDDISKRLDTLTLHDLVTRERAHEDVTRAAVEENAGGAPDPSPPSQP